MTYLLIFFFPFFAQVAGSKTSLVLNDVATYTTGMRMMLLLVNCDKSTPQHATTNHVMFHAALSI